MANKENFILYLSTLSCLAATISAYYSWRNHINISHNPRLSMKITGVCPKKNKIELKIKLRNIGKFDINLDTDNCYMIYMLLKNGEVKTYKITFRDCTNNNFNNKINGYGGELYFIFEIDIFSEILKINLLESATGNYIKHNNNLVKLLNDSISTNYKKNIDTNIQLVSYVERVKTRVRYLTFNIFK